MFGIISRKKALQPALISVTNFLLTMAALQTTGITLTGCRVMLIDLSLALVDKLLFLELRNARKDVLRKSLKKFQTSSSRI